MHVSQFKIITNPVDVSLPRTALQANKRIQKNFKFHSDRHQQCVIVFGWMQVLSSSAFKVKIEAQADYFQYQLCHHCLLRFRLCEFYIYTVGVIIIIVLTLGLFQFLHHVRRWLYIILLKKTPTYSTIYVERY